MGRETGGEMEQEQESARHGRETGAHYGINERNPKT